LLVASNIHNLEHVATIMTHHGYRKMHKLAIPPGKYVVAVSGGIDSMVLLDLLVRMADTTKTTTTTQRGTAKGHQPSAISHELTVAHFDHGIRPDSAEDRLLVEKVAARYGLPYIYEEGHLGPQASEATARQARYAFLHRVKAAHKADGIITAHHQDDALETAIINLLRGTGRKGLSSLQPTGDIVRPLLHLTKADIYDYAQAHSQITWREDSTNADDRYLRNYIRHQLIDKLGDYGRGLLLEYISKAAAANPLIDTILLDDIAAHSNNLGLERAWFIGLPYDVSTEVMAAWLRGHDIREFDRKTIARLVVAAKTSRQGKQLDVNAGHLLNITTARLQLMSRRFS
jgi:tRNA(Ile)-lysidine synthetase-like protein